jgi:phage head maturation protease
VKELLELDLYEISVVAAPANADTRFLSLKSTDRLSVSKPPLKIASFDA